MQILFYILIFLALVSFLGAILVLSFLFVVFKGAPFVATDKKKIKDILKFADPQGRQKILDLGSGDGRLVIAMARQGAEAYGYEINPFLVWWSRWKIKQAGLSDRAFVYRKDFWQENLATFDTVVVFGLGSIMGRLEEKLKKELPNGAKVISNGFSFPDWKEADKAGQIILYRR